MNIIHQTRCTVCRLGALVICALILEGCTGHGFRETALPTRIDYHCANNRIMKVERAKDASAAAVLVDNKPVILQRVSSPAQEKYTDGTYLLYLQGERAMLEKNSQVLFGPCSAGPLPKTVRDGFSGR
jgi:membrane-bound inhibitor of C-type lysozyme